MLGIVVGVDLGLCAVGERVGLLVGGGTGEGVADSVGRGVSVPADDVDVSEAVTGPTPVAVAVTVVTLSVGWLVGTAEGEAESAGIGVSEGSPGGFVGFLVGGGEVGTMVVGVAGTTVVGTVGTPDGVSVGIV